MKYVDKFFNVLLDVCILIAKILLIVMVLLVFVTVFMRYVLNYGIKWSDEVSMLLMVYFGFISIAYGVKQHLHLSVEILYSKLPAPAQRVISVITNGIVSFLGVVMAIFGVLLMQSTMNNVMTATRWPSATLYAAVPVTGILIAYFAFADAIGYKSTYKSKNDTDGEGALE